MPPQLTSTSSRPFISSLFSARSTTVLTWLMSARSASTQQWRWPAPVVGREVCAGCSPSSACRPGRTTKQQLAPACAKAIAHAAPMPRVAPVSSTCLPSREKREVMGTWFSGGVGSLASVSVEGVAMAWLPLGSSGKRQGERVAPLVSATLAVNEMGRRRNVGRKARGRVNRVPLPPVQSEEQTREEDTDEQLGRSPRSLSSPTVRGLWTTARQGRAWCCPPSRVVVNSTCGRKRP